jgi:integrase
MTTGPIKVWIVDYNRKFLVLQWVDPTTGKRKSQSSGCTRRRDAERKAIALEDQLNSLRPNADGRTEWQAFCDRFETHHCSSLKDSSAAKAIGVMSTFFRLMQPQDLRSITTSTLTEYATKLRNLKRSEATIAGHLTNLRVALRWAFDQGLIAEVPRLPRVARNTTGRRMKGRPISTAEFVQMLRATAGVVGKPAARSWRHLLRGLWYSGLRLNEAFHLTWDDPNQLSIDLAGQHPFLTIPIEHDKGHRERRMPLTPDFARFLLRTPEAERTSHVFNPIGEQGYRTVSEPHLSRVVSAIGEAAKVVVDPRKGKFASAHDLRRSFGQRWAQRVMPQVLRELMRHESLETTMTYYVGVNAAATAEMLWREHNT